MSTLELLLRLAGVLHFLLLIASASVPRVFSWRDQLGRLHPFLRRLFWVYGVFIVMVIIGFGVMTLRHAGAMAAGEPVARALCAFIAFFWAARLLVQWFGFDARPFLTNALLVAGYHALTLVFIYLTGVYAWAAFAPHPL